MYSSGTGFEGHAFFEAPSIRKRGDTYYFVYSSEVMHELCYAPSKEPRSGFEYGGVIVSNCDIGIGGNQPKEKPSAYGANTHGLIIEINGDWYIFYHRHTNGTWYSRQGCAEKIGFAADGKIPQVEITSCGLNGGPLSGSGEYPAYIVSNLMSGVSGPYVGDPRIPKVVQDGSDGEECVGYLANISDGCVAGFRYFDIRGVKEIGVMVRGYMHGAFEVKTSPDGETLGEIKVESANIWQKFTAPVRIPDGVNALWLCYKGGGNIHLKSFEFIC